MQKGYTLVRCFTLCIALLLISASAFSQDTLLVAKDSVKKDTIDYYDMSLEELQKIKAVGVSSELEQLINSLIGVASIKPLTGRESPSIISLITEEEIKSSGARDIMDVLSLVPGIDFGMDVEGVVGIGMRGNWAHEGKVLLLLDGQEMNENLFGTTQFGNHFPIDQIKKIEIIRGPGSAIYGGYAEYGVVNIITKNGEDINGVSVSGSYGQMKDYYGSRNVSIAAGKKFGDLQVGLSAFMGEGNRSDQVFHDFYGNSLAMAGNSALDPFNINAGLSWKGLSARFVTDQYRISTGDGYDYIKQVYQQQFNSTFAELKYKINVSDKFSITPRLNYKSQSPWQTPADSTTPEYHKVVDRYTGNLTMSYNITRKINVIFGGEVFQDVANDMVDSSFFSNGKKKVSYLNTAFFAQSVVKLRLVNIILGARYDQHSAYGSAFVPRLGLTKKIDKFHFKLLYSNSFRAPSIENINLADSTGIAPENTRVAELELGYEIGRNSIVTVNLFDINTSNAIVYYFNDSTQQDSYHNIGETGSRGVEVEYKFRDKWGFINLNYSFYSVAGKPKIADYEVPENNTVLLAFPAHKVNLGASFAIGKHFSVNPSMVFRGERYGYNSVDSTGTAVIEKFSPMVLANIFFRYQDLFVKGLDLGAGVYDIFDQRVKYIQPYNSYHAPLPGPSRELVLKLSYSFKCKKKPGS
ncbi:MAG: TonB-dependent receptor plug domain-containing protein [Bacteroidia bacterium]